MAELGVGAVAHVYFNLVPESLVVTHLLAAAADGNQSAEGFNLAHCLLELVLFNNQFFMLFGHQVKIFLARNLQRIGHHPDEHQRNQKAHTDRKIVGVDIERQRIDQDNRQYEDKEKGIGAALFFAQKEDEHQRKGKQPVDRGAFAGADHDIVNKDQAQQQHADPVDPLGVIPSSDGNDADNENDGHQDIDQDFNKVAFDNIDDGEAKDNRQRQARTDIRESAFPVPLDCGDVQDRSFQQTAHPPQSLDGIAFTFNFRRLLTSSPIGFHDRRQAFCGSRWRKGFGAAAASRAIHCVAYRQSSLWK